jgi:hypothetical protein
VVVFQARWDSADGSHATASDRTHYRNGSAACQKVTWQSSNDMVATESSQRREQAAVRYS